MRLLSIALLLVIASAASSGQARIVDEFSPSTCSDDLRARFDNFFVLLTESPGRKGYVSIWPGYDLPGRALKIRRMLSNHIRFRGFDPDRIHIAREQPSLPSVTFWLVPKGVNMASVGVPKKVTYLPETLFDSSGIFKVNSREVEFGGKSVEPCDFGLDLVEFAEIVKSEEESVVHLLATSSKRISRTKALTALKLTAEELSKKHGLAPGRIKTAYVGVRKGAEMQLWIVSNSRPAPKFREGTLP